MSFERWGSLSVADHIDTAALTANVLLYDRLIIPVMTDQPDRDESAHWVKQGWDPKLQKERLDLLDELAVKRPWNAQRRQWFKDRYAELKAEKVDASPLSMTKMILAQEPVEIPPGVQHVTVLAAYNSQDGLGKDFIVGPSPEHDAAQACLLTRRLAVPNLPHPEDSLREAIQLSRDPQFRKKRARMFNWQRQIAGTGCTPEAAVDYLTELTDDYNRCVTDACKNVWWKFALMIGGMGLGFAGGPLGIATATAAISVIGFARLDKQPAIEAGDAEPAAMFHDIETRIGLKLKP